MHRNSTLRNLLLLIAFSLCSLASQAQQAAQVNYQGVARKADGSPIAEQTITLKLTVKDGSATGTAVYSEIRQVQTNKFGLFTTVIGSSGALSQTGTLAGVNWASGSKYLQIELDPNGGNSYINMGTSQLQSVPYAIYANNAAPIGNAAGDLSGTYPNPTVSKIQGKAVSAATPNIGQILKWNGAAWTPADETAGAGTVGPQGPAGPAGAQGPQGPAGPAGATGATGLKGDTGAVGPQGPAGANGLAGPQGATGATGPKGDKGDIGNTGAQGLQGDKGDTGETGPKGDKGDIGNAGAQGPQGEKGEKGDTGETGPQGPAGADGPQGLPGSDATISIGAVGANSDANGLVLNSGVLGLTPADATNPGIITTANQSFAGAKSFNEDMYVQGLRLGKGAGSNDFNTTFGTEALVNNTGGFGNSAFGFNGLKGNTDGTGNTSFGFQGLMSNTTGAANTAMGFASLINNTTGAGNTAMGYQSLQKNGGSDNTVMGSNAMYLSTNANRNTVIGQGALWNANGANDNTTVGNNSLAALTTGANNVALGSSTGSILTTGTNNTLIGNEANVGSAALSNATAIGNGAVVTASNTIQLGNANITNVKTNGTLTTGAVTYPKIDGTSGQVLSTNGTGTIGWTSIAAANTDLSTGFTGVLPVANGGTGSATQNFVDLSTAQTITGLKTFSATRIGMSLQSDSYGLVTMNVGFPNLGGNNRNSIKSTAIGVNALKSLLYGDGEIAIGYEALNKDQRGNDNIGLGNYTLHEMLYDNATNSWGQKNIAIGTNAGYNVSSGKNNILIGYDAGKDLTQGQYNTIVGPDYNGYGLTTGSNNTIIGRALNVPANMTGNVIIADGGSNIRAQHDGTNWTLTGGLTAGGITYPAVNGTYGQVLSTNGSGTASWTTIPASNTDLSNGFSGILPVANGGTGLAALRANYLLKGDGTSAIATSLLYDEGTKLGLGTDSPTSRFNVFTSTENDGLLINGTATEGKTTGISLRVNLGSTSFNNLVQNGDAAIIYEGTTAGNASGFVIAPHTSGGVASGIRMDNTGNTTIVGSFSAGGITYPNVNGSTGQVLTTNGSGTATWETPSTTATAYSGILPVANGGTGSSTQNFVDLSNSQTIAGTKTFSSDAVFNTIKIGLGAGNKDKNTVVGLNALSLNTSGNEISAFGYSALKANQTGINNSAFGSNSMLVNNSGSFNTSMGVSSLLLNSSGSSNAAMGTQALYQNSTGSGNTAIGSSAMEGNTVGNNNTALGYYANVGANNLTNATAIGYQASVNASNKMQLGNSSLTSVATSGKLTTGEVTYPNTDGSNGQVLTTNGSGTASWAYAGGNTSTQTGAYTILLSDNYVFFGTTATAAAIFTLPAAASNAGKEIVIKNKSAYTLTVQRTGSETIFQDNANATATTITLGIEASNNWVKLVSDGTQWVVFRALF